MPRILVTPPLFKHAPGPYREVLDAAQFDVIYPERDLLGQPAEDLISQLRGIDAVLAGVERYDAQIFAAAKLRVIARAGVGYDSIDVAAATAHGVAICITPGTNEHSVAEQALALLFACYRDIARRDREVRQGRWRREPVRRLAGGTLGIVGLGRIGRALTPRAQGLGLRVLAYDPFPDREFAAAQNIELCSLDELLARSDIVSLHMPCTAETTDLINARTLLKMKRGAVLLNTSRGGLIDEPALYEALTTGQLSAAGLDVFKVEPTSIDHPLLKLDNVVVAPHMGGIDREALDAMGKLAAECIVNLYHAHWPQGCVVNETLRPAWKW